MSDQPPTPDPAAERSPWSRPSVLLSGAFLLALVLLGVVVGAVGNASGGGAARPASPPTAATRPAVSAVAVRGGGCSLPAGSQTVPSDSPPQAGWGTVGSMQVPQNSAVYGPQRSSGPWETCFAHDPAGALLAAMNFYAEGTAASPRAVLDRLAVDVTPADMTGGGLDADGPVQLAGYRYDAYTPAQAQVTIVLQGPEGKLAAVVTVMRWTGADWRYLAPADGTPSAEVLTDLTGYVAWSAF